MTFSIVILVVGLLLLLGGADLLIRGASALAERAGVPPLVVGLTVVAFGTSTPEVVVNVMSAANGQTGLLFGNIVGSCAVNIGFVLALTAVIRPLAVEPTVITREIPMLLLAVASMVVMSFDVPLGSGPRDALERGEGILLLLLFAVFLYYTVMGVLGTKGRDPLVAEVQAALADAAASASSAAAAAAPARRSIGVDLALTLAGFVAVGAGGRMTVAGAVAVAQKLGVPEAVVGLTIVSFGTTLPELITGITAARRGQADIALGNVVGSCIYNLLFIGGICATMRSVPIPPGGHLDLAVMAGLATALFPLALTGQRHITRADGALLLSGYLAYTVWRGVGALAS